MGSSLDTKLVAFNINTEPAVSEVDNDIIDFDEFNEIDNLPISTALIAVFGYVFNFLNPSK